MDLLMLIISMIGTELHFFAGKTSVATTGGHCSESSFDTPAHATS